MVRHPVSTKRTKKRKRKERRRRRRKIRAQNKVNKVQVQITYIGNLRDGLDKENKIVLMCSFLGG